MDGLEYAHMNFGDKMGLLTNKSFADVYKHNKAFVDFSSTNMSEGKGIFKFWLKYLRGKNKYAKSVQKPVN